MNQNPEKYYGNTINSVFIFTNEHNGYYGGFDLCIDEIE